MARPLRIDVPGGRYHVHTRGNNRQTIFRDDRDRRHFLELLAELPHRFGSVLHAFVLMLNHYHLLLEVPEANLSRVMQWLNLSYSVWSNLRHSRCGHFVQGRFKAHLIESDADLCEVGRYLHLNPVRVGRFGLGKQDRARQKSPAATRPTPDMIRRRLAVLHQFRWSSARAYLGLDAVPGWLETGLLGRLCGGRNPEEHRAAFQKHLEAPIWEGVLENPWERTVGGVFLGSEETLNAILEVSKENNRDEPKGIHHLQAQPSWEHIVQAIEAVKTENWSAFRDRHGDWGRDMALYLGRQEGRMRLAELAKRAGGLDAAAVGTAISRLKKQLARAPSLHQAWCEVKEQMSKMRI